MSNVIIGKRVLVLIAHPDDESFVCGGTIHLNGKSGGETYVSCATGGEAGRTYVKDNISNEELKLIRSAEFLQASNILGADKFDILDFQDKKIIERKDSLMEIWRELVTSVKPKVILSFGPDGYTGHHDHVVVGDIARQLASENKIPFYFFSLPGGERHDSIEKCLRGKRSQGSYLDHSLHKEPDVVVEVDPKIKLEAINVYKSQLPGLDPYHIFSKEDADHFLRFEYFVKS